MWNQNQDTTEQYRQLFEEAPVAYHELDLEGIVQRVSNAECSMLGYTRQEMVGHHICEFVPPYEKMACLRLFSRKVRGELPERPSCRHFRTKESQDIVVEVYDQLMRDGENEIIGIRSALVDVTKRLAAEATLREHQLWLDSAFTSIPEAIVIVDTLGLVKQMNPLAEEIMAWKTSSLLGKSFLRMTQAAMVSTGEDSRPYTSRQGIADSWSGVATYLTEDSDTRSALFSTTPLLTEDEVCIGIVLTMDTL